MTLAVPKSSTDLFWDDRATHRTLPFHGRYPGRWPDHIDRVPPLPGFFMPSQPLPTRRGPRAFTHTKPPPGARFERPHASPCSLWFDRRFRFTRSIAPHASSTATRLITHSPTTNADQRMPKITGNDKVIVIDTPGPVWKMPASTDIRRLHDCAGASSAQKRLPNR